MDEQTIRAHPTTAGALYTTSEVAKILRVAQRTVQDWIREGALPAVRYGRVFRVREVDPAGFGEFMPGKPRTPEQP